MGRIGGICGSTEHSCVEADARFGEQAPMREASRRAVHVATCTWGASAFPSPGRPRY